VDTRNAIAQLRAAEAQYAASSGTEDQASRAYDIAQLRYREGISTQTELSASRIQLQQARANRAQATRDLQVARLRVALIHDLPLGSGGTAAASAQAAIPTTSAQSAASSLGAQRAAQAQGVPGQPPIPGQGGAGAAGAGTPMRNRGGVP
jgi:outer membrane protein TolC